MEAVVVAQWTGRNQPEMVTYWLIFGYVYSEANMLFMQATEIDL
jgi:hypothetical protein